MSIATQLSRIETDRNTIRAKLVELGMANSTDKLDGLAAAIENIVNQGAVSVTVQEGDTYTIPAGYHNGSGTVSGVKGGGNYNLQSKTATPTKKQQSITPDSGYYGLSDVTVAPIPDAYQDVSSVTAGAGDVLTGKVYVLADGTVTIGTMPNNGAVSKTLDATTITYTIPKGYHNGSGKVTITLETKTVTPAKAAQEITPASGKVLSKVTVEPIPDKYQDVSGVTVTADKVLAGSVFVDKDGNEVEGTMPDHTNAGWITPLSVENNSFTIPAGYHDGERTVTVANGGTLYATPSKERQKIEGTWVEDDKGMLSHHSFISKVYVEPIPDKYQDVSGVTAGVYHVLEGEYFVDSNGNKHEGLMPNNGSVSQVLGRGLEQYYVIPEGYHDGTGRVSVDLEEKTVEPMVQKQWIRPTEGKYLSCVVVEEIPSEYKKVSGVTAQAIAVLAGSFYVDNEGNLVEGTMPNNGDTSKTFDGLATTSVDVPAGYTSGGTVSLTSDIEDALAVI